MVSGVPGLQSETDACPGEQLSQECYLPLCLLTGKRAV
jgi:hypothetical protein